MFIMDVTYQGLPTYKIHNSLDDEKLHRQFLEIARTHIEKLVNEFPEFKATVRVSSITVAERDLDVVIADNGSGTVYAWGDAELNTALNAIEHAVELLLVEWWRSHSDPWIQEAIAKPFEGYWEEQAARFGCD
jgi:hypothetical protein